jgi:hypothetical protein
MDAFLLSYAHRYFVVVDDIWDKESWESISCALKDNKLGSRIIITSRNYDTVSKDSSVYRLQPLCSGKSKELLYKRIFSGERECLDNPPAEVLEKIIDKCGGVPLAIIAIASLLAGRPWEDWSKVYESIVFGREDHTMTILSYSYHDLPSYLKPCLLILSIFPEDYGFEKHSFIWLWIAEGFIKEKEGESPFETGERYFNELVNRCMIQPHQSNADRSITGYGVHDIVLDLIRELSMEENFVTVLRNELSPLGSARRIKDVLSRGGDRKVRRLAIQNFHAANITKDIGITDGVRSLIVTGNVTEMMPPIRSFQACRVLDIVYCQKVNLKHLGKLRQLRILLIYDTPVVELHNKEIKELKFLQTLTLQNIGLDEMPAAVCDLTQLIFMKAIGFRRLPADRMGNLVALEELWLDPLVGMSETHDFVVQLGKLTRLRLLKIRFFEYLNHSSQEALVKSLCNLEEIKCLELKALVKSTAVAAWEGWEPPRQLWRLYIECFRFSRMPVWINPSRVGGLCYLSLSVDALETKDVDNLGRLQELLYLELHCRRINQGCTIGTERFKNLRVCKVDTVFRFLKGAMPKLESLSLKVIVKDLINGLQHVDFRTKDTVPDLLDLGLENLLSLEEIILSVDYSSALAVDVEEAVSLVTCAVKKNPNHPAFQIIRLNEYYMLSESDEDSILSDADVEVKHLLFLLFVLSLTTTIYLFESLV